MPEFIALLCIVGLAGLGVMLWRQQQSLRTLQVELAILSATLRSSAGAGQPGAAAAEAAVPPPQPPVARAEAPVAVPEAPVRETLLEPVQPAQPAAARAVEASEPAPPPDDRTLAEILMAERAAAAEAAAAQAAAAAANAPPPRPRPRTDVETALGSKWAVWVGGVALALGAIFLIRYTIEIGIFGPRLRLILAAVFGVLLIAGGEFLRRTGFRVPVDGLRNAYIPAILSAAGAFTLFGTVYAAHAVYGFIGPAPAFILLGLIGVVTIASALLHGQALAGLGLLGSYLTPALVSSVTPDVWTLFVYLAIVLVAAGVIARYRRWPFLMGAAFAGPGLWCLLYINAETHPDFWAVVFLHAAIFGVLGFVWLRGDESDADGATFVPAAITTFIAVNLGMNEGIVAAGGAPFGIALALAMLAIAVWRRPALPLLAGAVVVVVMMQLRSGFSGTFVFAILGDTFTFDGPPVLQTPGRLWTDVGLAAVFAATGLWSARRFVATSDFRATSWAISAAVVPLAVLFCNWLAFGNLDIDWWRALVALALAVALAAGTEWIARRETPPFSGGSAVSIVLTGAAVALWIAFTLAFKPGTTSVLMAMTAALAAFAARYRPYPALGWLAVASVALMLARVIIDPTIVGAENLSSTPVFNELLAGYGLPALAFAFAAWQFGRNGAGRPRHAMEASALLFALLAAAMLVRHAMHGGMIYAGELTLAEQAIYTLIAVGAGGILIALDSRSPSPVWQGASMLLGVVSMALIVVQHFLVLNPLYTEESTGPNPVFNAILLGYLLPAIAVGALALYARYRRPYWYVASLALTAAALAVAYFSLAMRRLFVGEVVGLWQGMSQVETYAYSALWLVLGVLLLIVGVVLRSQVLRLASAALVLIAVVKVFLFDMSELEGGLRALSFIGLGLVLIGIGLFYQRMLGRLRVEEDAGKFA